MEEHRTRTELAQAYRRLVELGLTEMASGNISVRHSDGMLISPTGATGLVEGGDFVICDFDGATPGPQQPSSEWPMHAEIYRAHPASEAVVHTHSDYCVALSCHNRPLPGFHYLVGCFGGNDVPCVPYSTFGSEQLAKDAAEALQDRSACLLGSHGMICRGDSLAQAVNLAHRLEIMCRQYLLACQLGEPQVLNDDQWREFFERASHYKLI